MRFAVTPSVLTVPFRLPVRSFRKGFGLTGTWRRPRSRKVWLVVVTVLSMCVTVGFVVLCYCSCLFVSLLNSCVWPHSRKVCGAGTPANLRTRIPDRVGERFQSVTLEGVKTKFAPMCCCLLFYYGMFPEAVVLS